MFVRAWDLPIKASWHRATVLLSLTFDDHGLVLQLKEESGLVWSLRFAEVQAFKSVTEESSGGALEELPVDGGFFELLDSPWLSELGKGEIGYMAQARHFVICCYDELIEVVAIDFSAKRI